MELQRDKCLVEWVKFWVTDHPDEEVLILNVLALYDGLKSYNTKLPAPLEHSFVLKEGVGIVRQTKDPDGTGILDHYKFMYWFSTLEALLAEKPALPPATRPAAFLRLWCQLLAQGGGLCCPALEPGGALWQAF